MIFLPDLMLQILEVELIHLKVKGLIFEPHSLIDGEIQSHYCRLTLLNWAILVVFLEENNLICAKGRQFESGPTLGQ